MAEQKTKEALQSQFEGIRDERRLAANTAYRIGDAFLSLLHFCADETSDKYLSKQHDDAAKGLITFMRGLVAEQMSKFKGGAQFGNFFSSLVAGKGAQIDANGNAEVESITVRSYMKVLELIVNRLSALEGDQYFTESDTIERIDDLGDSTYGLHLKSKYDGYFTAQHEGNVIRGIVNNILSAVQPESEAKYYTSWMRVNSVNAVKNYIEVTLYADSEVPGGKNFAPCELMNIARYGNQTVESLQSCFYISSAEGRIVKLTGVTKPILEDYNYGMAFGDLPEFIKALDLPLVKGRDYIYAAGIVTQDIIQIDYHGKPIVTYVDRGLFDANATYYNAAVNPETGKCETSDVWYTGCKWRCMKTGTHSVPRWNNTDWSMIEGNPSFTVDFVEDETVYDFDNFRAPLTIIATLYGQDITSDILENDVAWTRYTENKAGVQRVNSDKIWSLEVGSKAGKAIVLTQSDLSIDSEGIPSKIRFTATVRLRDGLGDEVAQDTVTLECVK